MNGIVVAVATSTDHRFSKSVCAKIELIAGFGAEGDTHGGITVQHRSRVARDPTQANLRQVHLVHSELFQELAARGFRVAPGDIGENISTADIDLLALPTDTELQIGATAVVRVTGLRNPCAQLDGFQPGLTAAVLGRAPDGALVRKAGVMGVVLCSGPVAAGDAIVVKPPAPPHRQLECV